MTPVEFVAGLAEVMSVEQTGIVTVDRVLAKAGLRKIARGKFRPDITLTEGLQVMLAWAGSHNLTHAVRELERLQTLFYFCDESSQTVDADFIKIFGIPSSGLSGTSLFDILSLATRSLGAGGYPAKNLNVVVEKQGGVSLVFVTERGRITLRFIETGKFEFRPRRNVQVTVAISGAVLKWIYDVTEGV